MTTTKKAPKKKATPIRRNASQRLEKERANICYREFEAFVEERGGSKKTPETYRSYMFCKHLMQASIRAIDVDTGAAEDIANLNALRDQAFEAVKKAMS